MVVVPDNGASAEGGPTGTTNEAQFFNNAQETWRRASAVIDQLGGPEHFNHYPWGWTFAGNTPSDAGSERRTAVARPIPSASSRGRPA